MTDIKYKSAPVSEVIFGVTFKNALLGNDNFYLRFVSRLIERYPLYSLHVPLFNEELKSYQNNLVTNPAVTGPALYRLRSEDSSWLIQIQLNKVYFNWVRDDQKDPGNYPGYTAIFAKFNELLNEIFSSLDATEADILYYELSYHDRIRWEDYVASINNIDEIVNYSLPDLGPSDGIEIANFSKNLNAKVDDLGGFMTLNYSTSTEITGKQILRLELSLKGKIGETSFYSEWYDRAHSMQIKLFEKFINPQILKRWQQ